MTVQFRDAIDADIPAVVALLRDDVLGEGREGAGADAYRDAFRAMQGEPHNTLIVGEEAGRIVATCHITFISGLTLEAARRVQIEGVRVASDQRGKGVGEAMIAEVERRAREAGCRVFQLTMNKTRTDTARFYERLGFTPSHLGYKRVLS